MANAGKVLALFGAILTILGTFLFTLAEVAPGVSYLYGVGGILNIPAVFQYAVSGAPDAWQAWIVGITLIIYLISGLIMLLGIKFRIASLIGCLIPMAVVIILILGQFGISPLGIYGIYFLFLTGDVVVPNVFPLTFEYGVMDLGGLGWGVIIVLFGGILAFISVFMSRED